MSPLFAAAMLLEPYTGMISADRLRTSVLTPAQITKPIMDLDCTLADQAGGWHRIKLHVSGGRGYGEPWAGGVLTTHTPQVGEVREDPSGLFQNLPHLEDKLDGLIFGRREGPWVEFRSFAGPPQFAVVSLSQRRNRYDRDPDEQTYVGHCEVAETAQEPLSEQETREFLAR